MDHSEVKHLPKVDHTPAELDDVSRILLKAATLIENRGWTRFVQQDAEGKMCLLGAMVRAVIGRFPEGNVYVNGIADNEAALYRAAEARLSRTLGIESNTGHHWNNADERTKEEVVSKLRAAAFGHGG